MKGELRDEALPILETHLARWEKELTRQEQAIRRIDRNIDRAEWTETLRDADRQWEALTSEALEFIFDPEKFPPGWQDPNFNGPFIGSDWVYAAEERCDSIRAPILEYVENRRAGVEKHKQKALEKTWSKYSRAQALTQEAGRVLGKRASTPDRNAPSQLLLALVALRVLDPADADPWITDAYDHADSGDEWTLWFAYVDAVDRWNQAQLERADREIHRCLVKINKLRAQWRLAPLQADRRLEKAAWSHCEEQTRLGYYDHKSPTAGREHYADRAQLAGYGPLKVPYVAENIDRGHSPTESYDRWRWDGGHYRTLADPKIVHVGLARHGEFNTLLVACGLPTQLRVIDPPQPE